MGEIYLQLVLNIVWKRTPKFCFFLNKVVIFLSIFEILIF